MKCLNRKELSQKKRKITLSWILKKLLTLVSYIFYPIYIRGSVSCWDTLLFWAQVPHRKLFGILRSSFAASSGRRKILYINYRWDLGEKTEGVILVTTDMVGIYSSISHIEGLEVLCKQYGKFLHKKVPTEDIKLAENVFLSLISSFSNKYVEPLFVLNLPFPI